jgi:hypothetical protein
MPVKITPPILAKRYGCDVKKIRTWIESGELRAFDASTKRDKKPRYLIDETDVQVFELSRQVQPPPPRVNRRRPHDPSVIQFF